MLLVGRQGVVMGEMANEVWINHSDSYSNFALVLLVGWTFLVGVGAAQSLVRAVL